MDQTEYTGTEEQSKDAAIVRNILSGRKNDFLKIIEKYQRILLSLIGRFTADPEDKQDILQEIFMILYKSLDKFDPERKLFTWTYTISINYLRNWASKNRKKFLHSSFDVLGKNLAARDETYSPEAAFLKNEKIAQVQAIIRALPPKYREPVILFYFQELSYSEIAEILGISLDTVKIRLFRAKKLILKESEKKQLI